jgi:Domain of unknown function (DUF4091)
MDDFRKYWTFQSLKRLLFSSAMVLFAAASAESQTTVTVGAFPSTYRSHLSAETPSTTPTIALKPYTIIEGGQGEHESFQIQVKAKGGPLTNVSLSVGEFRGVKGSTLARDNITLYREHYVDIKNSTPVWDETFRNKPLGKGLYPDALIPFVDPITGKDISGAQYDATPVNLTKDSQATFWVDVAIPPSAKPGLYLSKYTVTSDSGSYKGIVLLRVWDFALPLKPSFYSSFALYGKYDINNVITLLKNKIMPLSVPAEDQEKLTKNFGLNATSMGFWSEATVSNCSMTPPPNEAALSDKVSQYNTSLLKYNYTADEISLCNNLTAPMKQWGSRLQSKGVKNLSVMIPTSDFDTNSPSGSAVDIWTVLPVQYQESKDAVTRALKKGQQVWMYSALYQTNGNEPAWQLDLAPINYRITGFLSAQTGISGMLYWTTDWSIFEGKNPWMGELNFNHPEGYTFPGDGNFFYPGAQAGIGQYVESMRLKWLRDAVDDYEYMKLLDKCNLTADAKKIVSELGTDWSIWKDDPIVLARTRRTLGNLIASSSCKGTKKDLRSLAGQQSSKTKERELLRLLTAAKVPNRRAVLRQVSFLAKSR